MSRATFPVVVHVLLIRDERLFLLRRSNTGFMDGYFSLPGGHQDIGESVSEAAIRECLEETGVQAPRLLPVCVSHERASGQRRGVDVGLRANTGRKSAHQGASTLCHV